jgi:hypothetical protein
VIVDSNDIESKVVMITDAQCSTNEVLSLIPKGPKAIFRPFLKFGQAIVKAIFTKNS